MSDLIDSITAEVLRSAGFKRIGKKKRWIETERNVTRIVDTQKLRWIDYKMVNFGVRFAEVQPNPPLEELTASSGHIVGRAQHVLSKAEADQLNEASRLGTTMAEPARRDVIKHGLMAMLDFLRSFNDLESYKRLRGNYVGVIELAAISEVLGNSTAG